MTALDLADVKREAQARVFEVIAKLGVDAKPTSRGYLSLCNPTRHDTRPSLVIWTRGPAAGGFKDYGNGDSGDLVDLCSYLLGWWSQPNKGRAEARRWLIDQLALARVDPARLAADRAAARRRELEQTKVAEQELAEKRRRARALWLAAEPIAAGTPAEVYLRSRAIELERLPRGPRGGARGPNILRCLRQHRHSESGTYWPAMVAGCVDQAGEIQAVHCTFLDPLGNGKAPVTPVKKVWPRYAGLVIPLWRGTTFRSVAAANIAAEQRGEHEILVLTEGIEDGLTAALTSPYYRTWSFLSLGNLGNVVLPKCINGVLLQRQNEWQNREAVVAFDRGKAALERQGRPVAEFHALIGKDFNDTARAERDGGQLAAAGAQSRGAS